MTIDKGHTRSYDANYPLHGVGQSSKQFRDNFTVIADAIAALHRVTSTTASVLALSTSIADDGVVSADLSFPDNGFVLPMGDPGTPRAGMIRYREGVVECHDGTLWAPIGGVHSIFGQTGAVSPSRDDIEAVLGFAVAPLSSPALTGVPTAPTRPAGDATNAIATTAFVAHSVNESRVSPDLLGIPTAPTAMKGTATRQIATTEFLAAEIARFRDSPALTGMPTAPTAIAGTNTTQLATTSFVQTEIASRAPLASPALTGIPTAPTQALGTATDAIATTAFVEASMAGFANLAPAALANLTALSTALAADGDAAALVSTMGEKVSRLGDRMTGELVIHKIAGAGVTLEKSGDPDRNWLRWHQGARWWQAGFRASPHHWVLETQANDGTLPQDDSGWTKALEAHADGVLFTRGFKIFHEGNFDPADKADTLHDHDAATLTRDGFLSAADKAKLDGIEAGAGVTPTGYSGIATDHETVHAQDRSSILRVTGATGIVTHADADGALVIGVAPNAQSHGNQEGRDLHALAQADGAAGFLSGADKAKLDALTCETATMWRAGYMGAEDKDKLDRLTLDHATPTASGYLSAGDKAKLDKLANRMASTHEHGYMAALDKAKLDALPATVATAVATGLMAAADKAKLDSLTTEAATLDAPGYMSSADKAKLDGLGERSGLSDAFAVFRVGAETSTARGAATFAFTAGPGIALNIGQDALNIALASSDDSHGARPGGDLHALAVPGGEAGFLSGYDKAKLDSIDPRAAVNQNAFANLRVDVDGKVTAFAADQELSGFTFIQGAGVTLKPSLSGHAMTISAVASDKQHGRRTSGDLHALAIPGGAAGFLSGADKAKLDALAPGSFLARDGSDEMKGNLKLALPGGGGIAIASAKRGYDKAVSLGQDINGHGYLLNREAGALKLGTDAQTRVTVTPTGRVGIGTENPETLLHVAGDARIDGVMHGTATSALWADLAERYHADAAYEPGTVLVYGGACEVTLATRWSDPAVAGVVSTQPAMMLNRDAGPDDTHPYIALAGRVPCKVVGPIRKGDLLVTSNHPGVACATHAPVMGTIIGKALEDHHGGVSIIEIAIHRG